VPARRNCAAEAVTAVGKKTVGSEASALLERRGFK
jgi:hypothetical protein